MGRSDLTVGQQWRSPDRGETGRSGRGRGGAAGDGAEARSSARGWVNEKKRELLSPGREPVRGKKQPGAVLAFSKLINQIIWISC